MSLIPRPLRKPRKDSHLSAEERNVIVKYKDEYRSQPTRELRGDIFRSKILVDMFNHWQSHGLDPTDEAEAQHRIKVS